MIKQQIICDACGKEIPPHETRYTVTITSISAMELGSGHPKRKFTIIPPGAAKELDYCKFCFAGPVKSALETLTYTIEE